MNNISRKSTLFKSISLLLALTFSFYNVSFAVPKEDIGVPTSVSPSEVLSVDDIGIAIDSGTIKSKHSGNSGKVIVHIQDAHCNYEAQSNINKMLDQLTKECGINLISVEGSEGLVDTAWFRAFPDAEIRKEVATYFMKKGEITGAEFFSIISDYEGTIFGAETREYYVKNLKAFTEVYPYKDAIEQYFLDMKKVANRLKTIVYPAKLAELDTKITEFDNKNLELSDYATYLYKAISKNRADIKDLENFDKLLKTLEYEEKIDFDIVDSERSEYIDILSKKMSKEDMTELVTQSIRFKKGHIKAVDFYSYLRDLAKEHNISMMQDYPNLFYYYIYTKLYDGINNESLFKEIDEVEARLKKKLFKDELHERLDKYSERIDMYIDLINIELTNDDYDKFKAYSAEFSLEDVLEFFKSLVSKYNLNYAIDTIPSQISDNIPNMINFYEIAMKRDNALIGNTLKQMEKEGKNKCVLIAGGFHTRGIKNLLEKEGISYVVVTPKITKDVETPYIKVLTNQRTSLEDIITESVALPGTGITASREEIIRPKGELLTPLLRVAYTIPLYLNSPEDLDKLSEAIGSVEGRTVKDAAVDTYKELVSSLVREWILKVKEKAAPEVWQKAVQDWPLLLGAYLKKYEESAKEAGVKLDEGFRVPQVVLSEDALKTISSEFKEIFKGVVTAERTTPGTEALRLNDENDLYESLTQEQANAVDEVIAAVIQEHKKKMGIEKVQVAAPDKDGNVKEETMSIYKLIGFREAIEEYNATHKVQIPLDLRVHPGTGKGVWIHMYMDERDYNALTKEQIQRLANHEFYHILNPNDEEKSAIEALNDDLVDVRKAFDKSEKDRILDNIEVQSLNLERLKSIVSGNIGAEEVIAITNGGDSKVVEKALSDVKSKIFRADGKVKIMAHEEVTRRGQFLGLLDAMQKFEESQGFNKDKVSLGIMMPGKGTRMSPATQSKDGIKPFVEMLIRADERTPWLSGAAASLYTWNLVANTLEEMGFRGIAWKWGDEPQIASNYMKALVDSDIDMSETDIVRFGSKVLVTDDLAENKEWLSADEDGNLTGWARRRNRDKLLERLGVENTPGARAMVHIGSPAFSYVFIEEAQEVFKDVPQENWLDVDGYLVEALTYDKGTWDADYNAEMQQAVLKVLKGYFYEGEVIDVEKAAKKINAKLGEFQKIVKELAKDPKVVQRVDAGIYKATCGERSRIMAEEERENLKFKESGIHEVLRYCPDFYERCQELKKRINERRKRGEKDPLDIKVIDFGEKLYWGDIGQLSKARASLYQVAEKTAGGAFARKLASLENVTPDAFGNLVSGECTYPKDGSVRNSVLIDSNIYGRADINGAVIVNSDIGNAKVERGSVIFGSTALDITMGEKAFSFNSVTDGKLEIKANWMHTSMLKDLNDPAEGMEDWRADMTKDVGSPENYKNPKFGNPRSFEEQQEKMRKRDPEVLSIDERQKGISENFRKPMIERMKVMADRMKFKQLGFGTSGLRDTVENMTDMECYINTRGFIRFLAKEGSLKKEDIASLAGDLRPSTPKIMAAVAKAIEDEAEALGYNLEIDCCGFVPTPTAAFRGAVKGSFTIMVTGSHIPFDMNGIKFYKRDGEEVLKGPDEKGILSAVAEVRDEVYKESAEDSLFDENGTFKSAPTYDLKARQKEVEEEYVQRYLNAFPEDALSGLEIVLYEHSAVGNPILERVYTELGAKVIPVGASEKFIPIDTEKITPNLKEILAKYSNPVTLSEELTSEREWTIEMITKRPFAVTFTDGDKDRPGLADENGNFLTGDKLGLLVTKLLRPTFAAVPVSTNSGVVDELRRMGIKVVLTKIGSPHVVKAMNDELAANPSAKCLGWEANGGFLLGSTFEIPGGGELTRLATRDALLPLLASLYLSKNPEKVLGEKAPMKVSELIDTEIPHVYNSAGVFDKFAERFGTDRETALVTMKSIVPVLTPNLSDKRIIAIDFEKGVVERQIEREIAGKKVLTFETEEVDISELSDSDIAEWNRVKEKLESVFTSERGFTQDIKYINILDGIRVIFMDKEVSHLRPSGNAPEFRNYAAAEDQLRADEIVKVGVEEVIPTLADEVWKARTPGVQALRTVAMETPPADTPLGMILNAIIKGEEPIVVAPYLQPKVWGVNNIGEYWYGAEKGDKSSIAGAAGTQALMEEVMVYAPEEVLGSEVMRNFGTRLPLVKILTPKKRLSVQFHDAKNELWIVTRTEGENPAIILGFSQDSVNRYGTGVTAKYKEALEEYGRELNALIDLLIDKGHEARLNDTKDVREAAVGIKDSEIELSLERLDKARESLEEFYNYRQVKVGDVVPVAAGTLHALTPGIEIIEPQIAGPTQSLEDGATYPTRYYFPGYERPGGEKMLDIDRVNEMIPDVVKESAPKVIEGGKDEPIMVERLPGMFEKKGLEVHRVTLKKGSEMEAPEVTSFHTLVAVKGSPKLIIGDKSYDIPLATASGDMLIVPATVKSYRIVADEDAEIIDTFTPVPETREVPVEKGEKISGLEETEWTEEVVFADYKNDMTPDTYIALDIIGESKEISAIGDQKRGHTLVVQAGRVRVEKADGPVELQVGDALTFPENYTDYKVIRMSDMPARVKIDFENTRSEDVVYSVFNTIMQHLEEIQKRQVPIDIIIPSAVFVSGDKNDPGSKLWYENQWEKLDIDVRLTPYNDALGLGDAVDKTVRADAVAILVATKPDIQKAYDEKDKKIEAFLKGEKARVLTIPEIKGLEDRGWYFAREVQGVGILQAVLTKEDIDKAEGTGNLADDMQKLVTQLTGRSIPRQYLYYLLSYDEIGDAITNLPVRYEKDAFGWLLFLVNNVLLKMPIEPYNATDQLHQRRKVLWSV